MIGGPKRGGQALRAEPVDTHAFNSHSFFFAAPMEVKYLSVTHYNPIMWQLTHNITDGRFSAEDKCARNKVIASQDKRLSSGQNVAAASN